MSKRITATLAAMLLAIGMLALPAGAHEHGHDDGWGQMGPHPHALVLHVSFGQSGPAYAQCVDLAGGNALPKSNHHRGIHTGAAGTALRERAGHVVVPYDCAWVSNIFGPPTPRGQR